MVAAAAAASDEKNKEHIAECLHNPSIWILCLCKQRCRRDLLTPSPSRAFLRANEYPPRLLSRSYYYPPRPAPPSSPMGQNLPSIATNPVTKRLRSLQANLRGSAFRISLQLGNTRLISNLLREYTLSRGESFGFFWFSNCANFWKQGKRSWFVMRADFI